MMAVWGVIIMIFYFPMPESPRFLLAKGREEEARAFFLKYHANGAAEDELVEAEIAEIKLALEIDRTVLKKSWREIWRNPGDRWRFFISAGLSSCSLWSGQQIVSYYNTQVSNSLDYSSSLITKILNQAGITEVLQQLGINAGLSIWDLCCAVLGALLSGRVGRRPMFLISYTGQLITCAVSRDTCCNCCADRAADSDRHVRNVLQDQNSRLWLRDHWVLLAQFGLLE